MRVQILLLFLFAVLLIQPGSALLVDTSSHYDGYTIFDDTLSNGNHATVMIEFAVYERASGEFEDLGFGSAPGEGDFIYAYKIFNSPASEDMISYFGILDLDKEENAISGEGFMDDGSGGAEPESCGFVGDDLAWEWSAGEGGLRFIELGDESWLLVYSSEYDWVEGEYELRGTDESDFPKPGDGEVPEPLTVALLGAGGAYFLRRKRKS